MKLQIRNTRRKYCRGSHPDKLEASEDSPASAATTTMETAFCWTMAIPVSVRRPYPQFDLQALPARSSPAGAGIGGRDPPSQRNPPLQGLRCILYGRFRTSQILCRMCRRSTPKAKGSTRPKKEVGRRQLTPRKPFVYKAFQKPLFKSVYVFT